MPAIHIEPAREADVPVILQLITGLADYEKLRHQMVATPDDLQRWLFGPERMAEVIIARADGSPVGFALFYANFSTFLGKPGLYLEDLFVVPEWRGRGIGRQLLARLAGIAAERGYGRIDWAVLDWNAPAIAFYEGLGARVMNEWRICRLTGDPLTELAARRGA